MFIFQGHEDLGPRFAAEAANDIETGFDGLVKVEIDKNLSTFNVFQFQPIHPGLYLKSFNVSKYCFSDCLRQVVFADGLNFVLSKLRLNVCWIIRVHFPFSGKAARKIRLQYSLLAHSIRTTSVEGRAVGLSPFMFRFHPAGLQGRYGATIP